MVPPDRWIGHMNQDRKLYTIKRVEEDFGICRSTLYRLLSDRKVDAVKIGRRTMIKGDSLRAYVDALPSATFRPGASDARG